MRTMKIWLCSYRRHIDSDSNIDIRAVVSIHYRRSNPMSLRKLNKIGRNQSEMISQNPYYVTLDEAYTMGGGFSIKIFRVI